MEDSERSEAQFELGDSSYRMLSFFIYGQGCIPFLSIWQLRQICTVETKYFHL